MNVVLNLISGGFFVAGLVFFTGTVIGLVRFPDFYTRMHAAGKGDTLSALLILVGSAVYLSKDFFLDPAHNGGVLLVMLKILGIAAFIMLTSPTSTHALMRAGYEDANEPDPLVADKEAASPNLEERLEKDKEDKGGAG